MDERDGEAWYSVSCDIDTSVRQFVLVLKVSAANASIC
jgi:hypothetical protein